MMTELTMYQALVKAGKKCPGDLAIFYQGKKINFKTLIKRVDHTADILYHQLGVRENDVVVIAQPNIPETIVLFYALNKIGATSNLIHPFTPFNQVKSIMDKTHTKVAFLFAPRVRPRQDLVEKGHLPVQPAVPAGDGPKRNGRIPFLRPARHLEADKRGAPVGEPVEVRLLDVLRLGQHHAAQWRCLREPFGIADAVGFVRLRELPDLPRAKRGQVEMGRPRHPFEAELERDALGDGAKVVERDHRVRPRDRAGREFRLRVDGLAKDGLGLRHHLDAVPGVRLVGDVLRPDVHFQHERPLREDGWVEWDAHDAPLFGRSRRDGDGENVAVKGRPRRQFRRAGQRDIERHRPAFSGNRMVGPLGGFRRGRCA